jgi:hypothetical protein
MSTRISADRFLDLRAFLLGLMVMLHMSSMGARLRRRYRLARWYGLRVLGLVTVAALTIALLRWAYVRIGHESGRGGDQFVPGNRSS